jgi:putative glutamine amidotransferase
MKRVGIICDRRVVDDMPMHSANDEYVTAIRDGAGALPLLIPSMKEPLAPSDILAAVDGLLFTGAPSNIAPRHYGAAARPGTELDEIRDATTLPLLRAAIEAGKPVLAICRGFQELNVALGGSLFQHVHEIPGRLDHREPQNAPSRDAEYAPAHKVTIAPDGLLAKLSGLSQAMVNSLHHQGVDRLAPSLAVEATAPDGQIEAISMPGAKAFLLGVQWHPEWDFAKDSLSRAIFRGFGAALQALRQDECGENGIVTLKMM